MSAGGRRLTLSPIGFDIILALCQSPAGLRLADLAHVIGSPVSSVQTALRILVANQLVRRDAVEPPRYRLSPEHPAADELVSLASVLPEPAHAIGVVLRANPVVAFAAVDALGFLCVTQDQPLEAVAAAALDRQLELVAKARPETPSVMRMTASELDRLVRVAVGLAERLRKALPLKGRPPGQGHAAADDRRRTGSIANPRRTRAAG
jgi:hypothetical protein